MSANSARKKLNPSAKHAVVEQEIAMSIAESIANSNSIIPGERYLEEEDGIGKWRVAVNAEISVLDESIAMNNELRKRLKETELALEEDILGVIDSMGLVFDQKIEAINSMRAWRRTVETETKDIKAAVASVANMITPDRVHMLREFVELVERLNAVDPGLLVGRLFSEDAVNNDSDLQTTAS